MPFLLNKYVARISNWQGRNRPVGYNMFGKSYSIYLTTTAILKWAEMADYIHFLLNALLAIELTGEIQSY